MDVRAVQGAISPLTDKLADADPAALVLVAKLVEDASELEKHFIGREAEVVGQPRRRASHVRVRRGLADVANEYMAEFPDFWFSMGTLVTYWNQRNPEQEPVGENDMATVRRRLNDLIKAGEVERRRPTKFFEYRKVQ
jgi:hypothetical protein